MDATALSDQGAALLEQGRLAEAARLLHLALQLAPDDALLHYRLGLFASDSGNAGAALAAFDASIRLDHANPRAHNNRGSALLLLGRREDAAAAFREAMRLDAGLSQPLLNLGHLLESQARPGEAAALYRDAIARGLDVDVFAHHLAAVEGDTPARASDSWVRVTFDNFAPTFETQVLEQLGYQAPQRLAGSILAHIAGPLRILDLGCGTGLCGAALAHRKGNLTGVDLSQKMLALAGARGIYDELHCQEVHHFLAGTSGQPWNAIVAADVFIYIGALESIFAGVARVLAPGGVFAFSTEESKERDYALSPTGRYAQSLAYVRRLAQGDFLILEAAPAIIRKEGDAALAGRLYLLQKR